MEQIKIRKGIQKLFEQVNSLVPTDRDIVFDEHRNITFSTRYRNYLRRREFEREKRMERQYQQKLSEYEKKIETIARAVVSEVFDKLSVAGKIKTDN